ncbi:hypothetical protein ACV566_16215 [Staphylococcus aureus]
MHQELEANSELHSVGLGVMNLHGYLAKNKIGYESEEKAKDFADLLYDDGFYQSNVQWKSLRAWYQISDFEKSHYANGKYFLSSIQLKNLNLNSKKYVNYSMVWLLHLLEDWKKLQQDVEQYGLYHAYRLAIAPTQSISYVQNATSSVMPIVDQIERRTYGNVSIYPMPFLSPQTYVGTSKSAFNT